MSTRRFLLVAALLVASQSSGQAWVPPAGAGSVNVAYQTIENTGHFLTDGSIVRGYDSTSQTVFLELEYAFTDRFSVSASAPYVMAKYTGPEPSFSGLDVDECHCWNGGIQDVGLTARYNIRNDKLAITPFVSIGFPTHDYAYFGEAVLGRNLKEARFGAAAGQRLDRLSPRLSLQESYSYAVVERVIGLSTNRSNLSIEPALQLTRRLGLSVQVAWQHTHGGLAGTEIVTSEQWAQYDRIVRDNSFHAGAAVSYSFPRLDVFVSWRKFVDGSDTHDGRAITAGVSWPFEWTRAPHPP